MKDQLCKLFEEISQNINLNPNERAIMNMLFANDHKLILQYDALKTFLDTYCNKIDYDSKFFKLLFNMFYAFKASEKHQNIFVHRDINGNPLHDQTYSLQSTEKFKYGNNALKNLFSFITKNEFIEAHNTSKLDEILNKYLVSDFMTLLMIPSEFVITETDYDVIEKSLFDPSNNDTHETSSYNSIQSQLTRSEPSTQGTNIDQKDTNEERKSNSRLYGCYERIRSWWEGSSNSHYVDVEHTSSPSDSLQ